MIYSSTIVSAIRNVVKVYPGLSRAFEVMSIPAPYTLVVHYRQELQAYSDALPDEPPTAEEDAHTPTLNKAHSEPGDIPERSVDLKSKKHIPLLLDYVFTPEFTATYDHEMSLREKSVPSCTYALAWMLFRPGSMVYAWTGNNLDAYIVDYYELEGLYNKANTGRRRKNIGLAEAVRPPNATRGEIPEFSPIPQSILVRLHYLEFDGSRIGRRPKQITITPFEGEREIASLPVFPTEFAPEPKTKDALIERGEKYLKLCQRHYMFYQGDTITTASAPSRKVSAVSLILESLSFTLT